MEAVHFDKSVDAYKKAEVCLRVVSPHCTLDSLVMLAGCCDGGIFDGEGLPRIAFDVLRSKVQKPAVALTSADTMSMTGLVTSCYI